MTKLLTNCSLMKSLSKDKDSIFNMIGASFTLVLLKRISKEQYKHDEMLSFQTRSKTLRRLIDLETKNTNINNFLVLVINLSSHVLTE